MNKEELKKSLSDLFQELDQLGAEWERFRVDDSEQKKQDSPKFTANTNPRVYAQTVGNPLISKAEYDETHNIFLLDLVIPGVKDGAIKMSTLSDKITISFEEEIANSFTKNFSITLKSDSLNFKEMNANKGDGILHLIIPGKVVKSEEEDVYYL